MVSVAVLELVWHNPGSGNGVGDSGSMKPSENGEYSFDSKYLLLDDQTPGRKTSGCYRQTELPHASLAEPST